MAESIKELLDDAKPSTYTAGPQVPGLIGNLTRFTCDTARFPNWGLAEAGAIAVMGKLLDQKVMGPTRSGTHLYQCALAPTGSGKQHAIDTTKNYLIEARLDALIGPGDLASVQALQQLMLEQASPLIILDEFGMFMARISADGQSGNVQGIIREFNHLWGISFARYDGSKSASKNAAIVENPAAALLAFGVPDDFYRSLRSRHIGNGFLNRWLFPVASPKSQDEFAPSVDWRDIPEPLLKELHLAQRWADYRERDAMMESKVALMANRPNRQLGWGRGAEAVYRDLSGRMRAGSDEMTQQLQARVAENAVRLATIRAGGQCSPVVEEADMLWGCERAEASLRNLREGMEKHFHEKYDFGQLLENIYAKVVAAKGRELPLRDIKRSFGQNIERAMMLDEAIRYLVGEERLESFLRTPVGGGRTSMWYRVVG